MSESDISIVFCSRVREIKEAFENKHISGFGKDAIFEQVSKGWFITLLNSYESLFVGNEQPAIKVGDYATIRITFTGNRPNVGVAYER